MQYTTVYLPAPASDVAVRPVETGLEGMYYPNRPGARTIRDAVPLAVGNEVVTAHVYAGRRIAVHVGCKMPHDGPLPETVTERYQVMPWIQQYIASNFA